MRCYIKCLILTVGVLILHQDDQFTLAHFVLHEYRAFVPQDIVNDLKNEDMIILHRNIFFIKRDSYNHVFTLL